VLDLVPKALADLGVEQVFHRVELKPGKPLWFGARSGPPRDTLVFGLPGNPVSSLVCFQLFVRPVLARLAGRAEVGEAMFEARLARPFEHRSDRPTYHPSVVRCEAGGKLVEPLDWQGSADLRTLASASALAYFPLGQRTYAPGDPVSVRPL
jgi:molybdopterin molybdotransferase